MRRIVDGFLVAIQFLTTMPVNKNIEWDKARAKWSVRSYPLIGFMAGILLCLQIVVLQEFIPFSTLIIAFWLLFFSVLYSGGLHLDGWMDTSDAVFSHRDQVKKLEIMSDSRVGAFGVLSLFFLLGFRLLFIYEVLQYITVEVIVLIFFIPLLSRSIAALLLINNNPAKPSGMVAAYNGLLTKDDNIFIVGFMILTIGLTVIFHLGVLVPVLIFVILSGLYLLLSTLFFHKQFGGITGDTIGASIEGVETFLWGVLYLLLFYAMV